MSQGVQQDAIRPLTHIITIIVRLSACAQSGLVERHASIVEPLFKNMGLAVLEEAGTSMTPTRRVGCTVDLTEEGEGRNRESGERREVGEHCG